MELIDFDKTELLIPGEAEILTFTLEPMDLCSFDAARSSWVAEPGEYTVKVATSANDIKGSATFTLDKEMVVETVTRALVPEEEISKLTE